MKTILGWIQTTLLVLLVIVMTINETLAQEAIDQTRQVTPNERIRLEVMRGEVTIRTSNDNRFVVRGTLDEDALGYELESANGFTEFRVEMPRTLMRGLRQRQGSNLEILVPVNSDIEFTGVNVNVRTDGAQGGSRIRTVNGAISASNLAGFVELETVNGAITAENISGRVTITTVNGEVRERGSSGRLSIKAVNGNLDVDSRTEIVALQVVNGRIRGRLQGVSELDIESVNGGIVLALPESPAPRVKGSTVNGGIELSFDRAVSARFSLRSNTRGNIVNRLSDDEPLRLNAGPDRRLDFITGEGAGDVNLTSLSGRLELNRN